MVAEVAIGELQGEDVVTQEPTSTEVVSEEPIVEVVVGEIQRGDVVTQEPASPNILVEVAIQIGVEEPEAENIPDFNEEVYSVTLEPS